MFEFPGCHSASGCCSCCCFRPLFLLLFLLLPPIHGKGVCWLSSDKALTCIDSKRPQSWVQLYGTVIQYFNMKNTFSDWFAV